MPGTSYWPVLKQRETSLRAFSVSAVIALLFNRMIPEAEKRLVAAGHVFLRVAAGLMIFYIHGLHKLEGGIEYFRNGTPWVLEREVDGMHMPAPLAAEVFATLVQFICSLFIIVGLLTRLNALLLAGALGGAIAQNLLAGRDPQLAILYTLVVIAILLMGGGPLSLDSRLIEKKQEAKRR
jgi:putative oxidoreductase